jgi:phosphohistidine phosphatase SixA
VPVLLIRHAIARPRDRWDGDDDLRPLTKRGREQATGLVKQLAKYRIDQIFSSPAVRCVDTVAPLAQRYKLRVVTEKRLAEGNGELATKLLRRLARDGADVALCTHGDVVPEVMEALGFDCHRCAKGSTWVIDGERAVYLPPPPNA